MKEKSEFIIVTYSNYARIKMKWDDIPPSHFDLPRLNLLASVHAMKKDLSGTSLNSRHEPRITWIGRTIGILKSRSVKKSKKS